ncbi:cytochrome P450 [Novosphingobium sp. MMS21-SN21R]|uniref:cytochrome P450 n=1 Tax=Novosphingobium sp. MMS21-SN21R TaxID=2969298 RepID=UPI0028870814|nr:cytochrome P450 [Novosphingobium sp. MMS21-SN21R]MDT0508425.1 cytochrome P450 [Novosphingobium sp. MMS21-SN21R]
MATVEALPREGLDVSEGSLWAASAWRPMFARLREEDPVNRCENSIFGPYWSITRYDDIVAVEADPQTFSSSWEHGGIVIFDMQDTGVQLRMFIAMDDPEHGEKRKAIAPAVAPSEIAKLAGPLRERTAAILDSLPVGHPFDWVHSVSIPLTTAMIATLFNFPWDERDKLPEWSDWAAKIDIGPDPVLNAERERHVFEMAARFKELYEERRAAPPQPDLLSMMAHSASFGEMDEQRFIGAIALLLVGGNDTTRNSMSGLIERINQYPDAWAAVKADVKGLASGAATETIRLQTPIAHMRRTATRDVEFGGKTIRKGDKVVMWYNSGNRDEDVFPDGDRWDPTRENSRRHLSFGYGIHRCLGARLAELQLVTLIEEMAARDMEVKLVSDPERLPSCFTNGYEHIMVTMTRGDGANG